jgi:hypothetical protein
LFVQAGMNDIDRRCDAFLSWLDDKKRSREPFLKQLLAASGATAGILKAVDAGPKSIALAAIAFNLASDTFTNVSSRLLQDIDGHVVQSVVLDNQQKYRRKVLDLGTTVDNKPAAIYLLRGYLRICAPFSIEASISNTVTVYHRGGAEALAKDDPILTRSPEVAGVIANATAPLTRPPKALRVIAATRLNGYEESLSRKQIMEFQTAVCVTPDGDLGPLNSKTRVAIKAKLIASDQLLTPRKGILLRRILRGPAACP